MTIVFTALGPVLVIIATGYALKRVGFPGEGFWRPAARMVYFVFFPALLIRIIAVAQLDVAMWKAQVSAVGAVLFCVLLLQLSLKLIPLEGPAFTSVMQGSIRHNTYIGLAIGNAILSANELAAFAILVAVIVPLVNAISVTYLSKYGSQHKSENSTLLKTARQVALNPLILACLLGALLNVTRIGLPFGSEKLFQMLGQPALPLGLLVVGAGLQLSALKKIEIPVLMSVTIRLVLYPMVAISLGYLFGLEAKYFAPLALLSSLPTAASSYVLALELGGDEALMARIITVETVLAALTIPIILKVVL